ISDLVTNLSDDKLLRDEAACRLAGDLTSPTCADAISRITRYPDNALFRPGEIKEIRVNPINAAATSVDGIDVAGKYVFRTKDYGSFIAKANYSKTLNKHSRQFSGDPLKDDLDDLTNYDWRDKLNASVTWNNGKWSNTLFFQRYGKVPNAAGDAFLTPTTLVNASVQRRCVEGHAGQQRGVPAVGGVHPAAQRRTCRAAGEEQREIDAIQAAAHFRAQREDGALTQHQVGRHTHIQHDRRDHQHRQRHVARTGHDHGQRKSNHTQRQRGGGGHQRVAVVGQLAGDRRGHGACHADQCEDGDA
ncbi:conserved hypothetical protein, partial [Ricinus communis]